MSNARMCVYVCVRATANVCRCPNGSPKRASDCTKHDAAMCASCKRGFTVNSSETACIGT